MARKEKRGGGRNDRGDPRGVPQPEPSAAVPSQPAPEPPPPADPPQFPPAAGHLYTRCPVCKTAYRISLAQLRQGRGEAYCLQCETHFDALQALAETADRSGADPPPAHSLPRLGMLEAATGLSPHADTPQTPRLDGTPDKLPGPASRLVWGIGALFSMALLGLQMARFAGTDLPQDERLRPWLERACGSLGCDLPRFRAPLRIQILGSDLTPAPGGVEGYEFTLVLANQAALPQDFPAIKLSLEGRNGSPAASREFQPDEYLAESGPKLMPVGEPVEVRLLLSKPSREIDGFSVALR